MMHVRDFASKIFDFCTKKFSLMYPFIQTFNFEEMESGEVLKLKSRKKQPNQSFFANLINHPVHISDKQSGKISTSAFIPFCEFGGNMSSVGTKIKEFSVPICTAFEPTVLYDQLCYEIDLEKFKDPFDIADNQLKKGFVFIMDYNEDRQVSNNTDAAGVSK